MNNICVFLIQADFLESPSTTYFDIDDYFQISEKFIEEINCQHHNSTYRIILNTFSIDESERHFLEYLNHSFDRTLILLFDLNKISSTFCIIERMFVFSEYAYKFGMICSQNNFQNKFNNVDIYNQIIKRRFQNVSNILNQKENHYDEQLQIVS